MPYLNFSTLVGLLHLSFVTNSTLHKYSRLKKFSRINKSTISDYSYISNSCNLNCVIIRSYSSIGPRVVTINGLHPYWTVAQSPLFHQSKGSIFPASLYHRIIKDPNTIHAQGASTAPITIEEDVWIGADVKILSGVRIGRGSVIGACSFVNKVVPPYSIAYGVPVRVVRPRFSLDIIKRLEDSKWWSFHPSEAAKLLKNLV